LVILSPQDKEQTPDQVRRDVIKAPGPTPVIPATEPESWPGFASVYEKVSRHRIKSGVTG